jgi:hypothetical protein
VVERGEGQTQKLRQDARKYVLAFSRSHLFVPFALIITDALRRLEELGHVVFESTKEIEQLRARGRETGQLRTRLRTLAAQAKIARDPAERKRLADELRQIGDRLLTFDEQLSSPPEERPSDPAVKLPRRVRRRGGRSPRVQSKKQRIGK